MLASILIIAVSVALFVYWFRYTCLLILSAKTARDYANEVAAANQLNFIKVRSSLTSSENEVASFENVYEALERDYRVVTYLMNNAVSYDSVRDPLEHWILRFDYKLMSIWFWMTRSFSSALARRALLEMTSIVGHFANSMGQRIAVSVRT